MPAMRSSTLAVTLCAALLACARDVPDPRADAPALLTASEDTSQNARLLAFAARQQAFLRAVTEQSAELGSFIGNGFMFRDWAMPEQPIARDFLGNPLVMPNRFTSLNTRIEARYAAIKAMELNVQRPNNVLVVVRHPDALPSITGWWHEKNGWRVYSLSINVPEADANRIMSRRPVGG